MGGDLQARGVAYGRCNDRRPLGWFANQRAVEYHPTLIRADRWDRPTHLVLARDPPSGDRFGVAVRAAHLVGQALADAGLAGVVKTSGAKGVQVVVPIDPRPPPRRWPRIRAIAARAERLDPELATTTYLRDERGGKVVVDSTRAYGAMVVAAYSPGVGPGVPGVVPGGVGPARSCSPADLVEEGRAIPVARVQAMHEGKRRARARRG